MVDRRDRWLGIRRWRVGCRWWWSGARWSGGAGDAGGGGDGEDPVGGHPGAPAGVAGGGGRVAGGRVVRVMPEGVVTVRIPSGVIRKRQPRAWVLRRWWVRHRQHRLVQSVGPPRACGVTWSAAAGPTRWPRVGVGEGGGRPRVLAG